MKQAKLTASDTASLKSKSTELEYRIAENPQIISLLTDQAKLPLKKISKLVLVNYHLQTQRRVANS